MISPLDDSTIHKSTLFMTLFPQNIPNMKTFPNVHHKRLNTSIVQRYHNTKTTSLSERNHHGQLCNMFNGCDWTQHRDKILQTDRRKVGRGKEKYYVQWIGPDMWLHMSLIQNHREFRCKYGATYLQSAGSFAYATRIACATLHAWLACSAALNRLLTRSLTQSRVYGPVHDSIS